MATAERREREKAQRRRQILEAATEVFLRNGIRRATMDAVAEQAEISKGTIYLYFESKETLLAHLLLEGLDMLSRDLEAAYAAEEPLPAEERLRRLARAYLHFARTHPHYYRLMVAFDRGRFQESVPADTYQEVLARSLNALKWVDRAIRQGVEAGDFATDDSWQAAGILWAALNGVLVLMGSPIRRQMLSVEVEPMFDATLDLMLRGLRNEQ